MPQGELPQAYLSTPTVKSKSLDRFFEDLQGYTGEWFATEEGFERELQVNISLPPLQYKGHTLKGVLWSDAVDALVHRYPRLKDRFHVLAYGGWCGLPWSEAADGYLCSYANPKREKWFQKKYPKKADKLLIPLSGRADNMNEYEIAPVPVPERDIDVLCVARLSPTKNLPMIAQGLKAYRDQYAARPIRMTLVVGKPFDYTLAQLDPSEQEIFRELETILVHMSDYLEIIPALEAPKDLSQYYSRAKMVVMGSLVDGKSRCMAEALSCNTPVICFDAYNQHVRGKEAILPDEAGLCVDFTPDALATAMHDVLEDPGRFRPRRAYLEHFGKRNYFNRLVDHLPYYEEHLPEYVAGAHFKNFWLDMAVFDNYQVSLYEFVYEQKPWLTTARGIDQASRLLEQYLIPSL